MEIIRSIDELNTVSPCAVALGAFDGLHRGHRVLIDRLLVSSRSQRLCTMVYTFDPHPDIALHPDKPFPQLMTKTEKEEMLSGWGVDALYYQSFDAAFHTMEPEKFIDFLASHLRVRLAIAGYDYHFGYRGKGDAESLAANCAARGIEAVIIPPVRIDGMIVSSTRIREALAEGDITLAGHLLGYDYTICGQIARGRGRGSDMGYPTANLTITDTGKMLPKSGVYVTEAAWDGERRFGITNVGVNPTFETDRAVRVETHIPGWSGELYGKKMRLSFLTRLRDEQPFPSREALIEQLSADKRALEKFVYKKKDM